jgi:tetraacyldisaccharide 4'-kinase
VQLKRNMDIVLFDYNDDPDTMTLLPRGRLREPLSALGRASAIIVTKIPQSSLENHNEGNDKLDRSVKMRLEHLRQKLSSLAPAAVLHYARFVPSYLLAEGDGNSNVVKLTALSGKKVFALCGIARPEGFFASLTGLGATVADQLTFCDHHWYTPEDVKEIDRRFRASGAAYIVTSEKDKVRLPLPADLSALTYALMLEPVWLDSSGTQVSNPSFIDSIAALVQVKT